MKLLGEDDGCFGTRANEVAPTPYSCRVRELGLLLRSLRMSESGVWREAYFFALIPRRTGLIMFSGASTVSRSSFDRMPCSMIRS